MTEAVESYTHAGVRVEIHSDEDPMSPREHDNLAEMFCSYPGYELGDTQLPSDGFEDIDCPACDGYGYDKTDESDDAPECDRCYGTGHITPTLHEWLLDQKAIAAAPLFVYEHSGITMRTGKTILVHEEELTRSDTESRNRFMSDSAGWDTSLIGFIITTEERVSELCGDEPKYRTLDFLSDAFETEVDEYAKYLEGQAYGYIVGEDTPFEDSCWGFLGFEHVKDEANRIAETVAEELAHEETEKANWAARDVVTHAAGRN